MSSATVTEIITNLQDQERVYRRLLDLSQAQVTAIRTQDVRSVHALLQEIELTMIERSKIERRREDVLRRLALEHGVLPAQITATWLAERSEPAVAESIRTASENLRMLIGELDVVVDRSRGLLEQELELIDHMVQGITRTHETPTYASSGTQREGSRKRLLDAQV